MSVLGGIIWVAVVLVVIAFAVFCMYRVNRRSEARIAQRRAEKGMWGAGAGGAVGARGAACSGGGGCTGGGGCGGGGCGGGGGGG